MHKHLLTCLLLGAGACAAKAQKPFIDGLEAKIFTYWDSYSIAGRNWSHHFKNGYQPFINSDTVQFGLRPKGGAFPNFDNGWSLRLDLVKGSFPKAGSRQTLVDWYLGIGYRKYMLNDHQPFSDEPDPWHRDTTKRYKFISEDRTLSQHYADIQTRAVFKLGENTGSAWFYAGLAFQASLAFAGRLQEEYVEREERWDPNGYPRGYWIYSDTATWHQDVPGKNTNYFSWGIPFGLSARISRHLFLVSEVSYWHNLNRRYNELLTYGGRERSYSESIYLTIGMRYNMQARSDHKSKSKGNRNSEKF